EVLGAVEHVVVARAPRGGADRARVRAGARLREREAAEPLAAREPGQVPLPLRLGAERKDRPGGERGVRREDDAGRRARGRQLLDRERVGDVVEARAAVALGDEAAHHTEAAELADQLAREALAAVRVGRRRPDALLCEG